MGTLQQHREKQAAARHNGATPVRDCRLAISTIHRCPWGLSQPLFAFHHGENAAGIIQDANAEASNTKQAVRFCTGIGPACCCSSEGLGALNPALWGTGFARLNPGCCVLCVMVHVSELPQLQTNHQVVLQRVGITAPRKRWHASQSRVTLHPPMPTL